MIFLEDNFHSAESNVTLNSARLGVDVDTLIVIYNNLLWCKLSSGWFPSLCTVFSSPLLQFFLRGGVAVTGYWFPCQIIDSFSLCSFYLSDETVLDDILLDSYFFSSYFKVSPSFTYLILIINGNIHSFDFSPLWVGSLTLHGNLGFSPQVYTIFTMKMRCNGKSIIFKDHGQAFLNCKLKFSLLKLYTTYYLT